MNTLCTKNTIFSSYLRTTSAAATHSHIQTVPTTQAILPDDRVDDYICSPNHSRMQKVHGDDDEATANNNDGVSLMHLLQHRQQQLLASRGSLESGSREVGDVQGPSSSNTLYPATNNGIGSTMNNTFMMTPPPQHAMFINDMNQSDMNNTYYNTSTLHDNVYSMNTTSTNSYATSGPSNMASTSTATIPSTQDTVIPPPSNARASSLGSTKQFEKLAAGTLGTYRDCSPLLGDCTLDDPTFQQQRGGTFNTFQCPQQCMMDMMTNGYNTKNAQDMNYKNEPLKSDSGMASPKLADVIAQSQQQLKLNEVSIQSMLDGMSSTNKTSTPSESSSFSNIESSVPTLPQLQISSGMTFDNLQSLQGSLNGSLQDNLQGSSNIPATLSSLTSDVSSNLSGSNPDEDPGWEENFKALQVYHREHGHCKVSSRDKDNPKLGRWVMTQRRQFTLLMQGHPSALTAGRIRRLEGMGFAWSVRPEPVSTWNEKFEELKGE